MKSLLNQVRTSDQFYLLASRSFQDMNDWVNCLRLVAFGQAQAQAQIQSTAAALVPAPSNQLSASKSTKTNGVEQANNLLASSSLCSSSSTTAISSSSSSASSSSSCLAGATTGSKPLAQTHLAKSFDVLLDRCHTNNSTGNLTGNKVSAQSAVADPKAVKPVPILTASQAAAAAASALAKTRQRQPSLLGSCKPLPPTDSPFLKDSRPIATLSEGLNLPFNSFTILKGNNNKTDDDNNELNPAATTINNLAGGNQMNTLTPTLCGQLISATKQINATTTRSGDNRRLQASRTPFKPIQAALDEEEENMLYCSIEDNPSEHNYRVKIIETELALRCQLKCYQLSAPKTINQQYEELSQFQQTSLNHRVSDQQREPINQLAPLVTFYQLIIGPQELTLLNDYAICSYSSKSSKQQQGLWSWPYQCIRRYGFDKDNCFMFEAGRKCTSGPGQFIVQTPKAYNIYQDVVKFVNELRTISTNGNSSAPSTSSKVSHDFNQENLLVDRLTTAQNGDKRSAVITQIPVTWTPGNQSQALQLNAQQHQLSTSSSTTTTAADLKKPTPIRAQQTQEIEIPQTSVDSRKQFFSQLSRQVDDQTAPKQSATKTSAGESNIGENTRPKSDHQFGQKQALKTAGVNDTNLSSHDLKQDMPTIGQRNTSNIKKQTESNRSDNRSSDETDESGYEQGDDAVEHGPIKKVITAQVYSEVSTRHEAIDRPVVARTKLSDQHKGGSMSSAISTTSSLSSSSGSRSQSTLSSADSSPGHSVSRRTGETIQLEAKRQTGQNQLMENAKLSLSKMDNGPIKSSISSNNNTTSSEKTNNIHSIIAGGILSTDNCSDPKTIDFETNLIRDVYSEITKLHAKFAVTSSGSGGDDSMSCDSRESSVAISERLSNADDDGDDDDDDDDEEESNSAEDGCYYMNEDSIDDDQDEPMYSNLRPLGRVDQVATRRQGSSSIERSQSHQQQRSRQMIVSQQGQRAILQPIDMNQQTNNYNFLQQQPSRQIERNTINTNPFTDCSGPISPSRTMMRPNYPTILNPIPEINEVMQQNVSNRSPINDRNSGTTSNRRESVRNELQPSNIASITSPLQLSHSDREVTTTRRHNTHLSNAQEEGKLCMVAGRGVIKSRPTNHYVINDVQYAKISRNINQSRPKFR